ncbi:MAG TPA: hypothetical protein VFH03_12660 [Actinoplanes sp.]|nr:hypothetical protein [Actinoplanes sp.]
MSSLAKAHTAQDHQAWLDYFRSPDLSVVTLTVTEAGYLRGPDGGLDTGRPEVQADLSALRDDPTAPVRTTPARLVGGLAAATLILAAWIGCLRGRGAPVTDVRAETMTSLAAGALPDAVRRVIRELDPALSEDADVVATVLQQCHELGGPLTGR